MKSLQVYIRFSIVIGSLNSKGLAPIRCRITYNKKLIDFSTGIFIQPEHWNPKKIRLLEGTPQEETVNMQLILIENKISKAFLMLQVRKSLCQYGTSLFQCACGDFV